MFFKKKNIIDLMEEESTDYKDRCGNCTEYLAKEDKYCRYCGTKRGEGAFKPYRISSFCIYGPPPVKRKHVCKHCGNSWTAEMMIDKQKYCGQCGMPAEILKTSPYYYLSNKTANRIHNISAHDGNVRIGRKRDLEIPLEDSYVSQLHAQFEIDDDGNLYIMDMGSTNGTYVNQQKIGKQPYLLHSGDEIVMGRSHFTLESR